MVISLRIPQPLVAEIDKLADLDNRSRNAIIVRALREYMGIVNRHLENNPPRSLSDLPDYSKAVQHIVQSVQEGQSAPIVKKAVEHARHAHDQKTCRIYGCLTCKQLKKGTLDVVMD
jgi:metal-responsive CopG/Arc/MetJ family transcriptional regulator